MKYIETLDQWNIIAELLAKDCFELWQFQYSTEGPEGFHARFWVHGRPDVEIVTHNPDVQHKIVRFNAK